ncbi:Acetophenone carboxylase gamma subunit [Koleobacter methoxysyntrophicus]|uniref:Acetophenone carboxylase gamma subunit n=1 Tax=Koleobacter methoxysyntrophicus TaxID=2751313 RepID=A0A8A0RK12_9FIRM|nr:hydantoinase/oxoprolinase family protein [Koleobacter methoxysyntrophicus]QSQ08685.1 Acetophenone carboxylase gamma subunit [Koleobacter methoxysyntrophicus]
MIIGFDMGGTHADVVLLKNGEVYKKTKYPRQEDFLTSILKPLDEILKDEDLSQIERVIISTTLSTNAIVENRMGTVGMIVQPGPGLNLEFLEGFFPVHYVDGYIDHRGREREPLNISQVRTAGEKLKGCGAEYLGVVGKFSTRNPIHEIKINEAVGQIFKYSTMGHILSGNLNFPRRIFTAYLNSGVWKTYRGFLDGIKNSLAKRKIMAPIYIMKADGGTFEGEAAADRPVETILSGPAASIMGALALNPIKEDGIILDIGGTTTDISFLAEGIPLFEPRGIEVAGFKTLIRGLYSRSIGVGGDSLVEFKEGQLKIGPKRAGPAMAFGGSLPTPTDAMVVLGLLREGSESRARRGIETLARKQGLSIRETAAMIYEKMGEIIAGNIRKFLLEVNSRPVYTIYELLHGKKVSPKKAVLVGGPALGLSSVISRKLGIPCTVPKGFETANALGAALARVTAELTLVADTQEGVLIIGEEEIRERISSGFTLDEAKKLLFSRLKQRYKKLGGDSNIPVEIIEQEQFNVVRGFYTAGKIIRLKAQVRPGVRRDRDD